MNHKSNTVGLRDSTEREREVQGEPSVWASASVLWVIGAAAAAAADEAAAAASTDVLQPSIEAIIGARV